MRNFTQAYTRARMKTRPSTRCTQNRYFTESNVKRQCFSRPTRCHLPSGYFLQRWFAISQASSTQPSAKRSGTADTKPNKIDAQTPTGAEVDPPAAQSIANNEIYKFKGIATLNIPVKRVRASIASHNKRKCARRKPHCSFTSSISPDSSKLFARSAVILTRLLKN